MNCLKGKKPKLKYYKASMRIVEKAVVPIMSSRWKQRVKTNYIQTSQTEQKALINNLLLF